MVFCETESAFIRCDDDAECAVFTKYDFGDGDDDVFYDFSIEDSYCSCGYMGIKGRLKRAWHAFWAKPIYYSGVSVHDKEKMKQFLKHCLAIMDR